MSLPSSTVAQDVQDARRAAHAGSCPPGQFPCAACVPVSATVSALEIIRAGNGAPSTCRPARLALHDFFCRSGCVGASRDEHARRQDGPVRELRRYVRSTLQPVGRIEDGTL